MKALSGLAAAVLLTACGLPSSEAGGPRSPAAVAVGRIVCEKDGTRVLTPRIRARPDGVHIMFVNRSGADELYMRGADDPNNNHGGRLRAKRQKDVSSHGPGVMWVACFERGDLPPFYDSDERYAEFEIVDPKGLWVSWELQCSERNTITNKRVRSAQTQGDVLEWFRRHFNLPPGDFQRPGYPKTQWKGNPWVLLEDDRTIANVHAFRDKGVWTIAQGGACTDS